ncbi:MAG: hypothetical protein O3B37_09765 [Proteobacteria bacterium]|nr:hypothetical protein [Pseudomonadota bacterium]
MARKTNYSFEKRQRELQKKEKKAAKAEAKRALADPQSGDAEGGLEPAVVAPAETDKAE